MEFVIKIQFLSTLIENQTIKLNKLVIVNLKNIYVEYWSFSLLILMSLFTICNFLLLIIKVNLWILFIFICHISLISQLNEEHVLSKN